MTIKTFLNKLKSTRENMQWFLTKDGRIRALYKSRYQCPLTAVYNTVIGKRANLNEYEDIANDLELDDDQYAASDIQRAADCTMNEIREEDYFNDKNERLRVARFRQRLLNALELKEV